MKIGVPANGDSPDARVESCFRWCSYVMVVDLAIMDFRFFPNPVASATEEAGLQVAEFIKPLGVEVILTGHIDSDIQDELEAAGIEVVTGVRGKIGDIVGAYLASKFRPEGR
jgi:predicted Fe-Mo cluster-binding NifX family protein